MLPGLLGFLGRWGTVGVKERAPAPVVAYGAAALHTLVGLAAGEELAGAEHLSLLVGSPVVLTGPGGSPQPRRGVCLWKRG